MKRRYHIPTSVKWNANTAAIEKTRLQQAVVAAIGRAIESLAVVGEAEIVVAAEAEARELFSVSRYSRDRSSYAVPNYDNNGNLTEIPVEGITFEPEQIQVIRDRVIEKPPPFEGAVILQLPGNHYVRVSSHRYATTTNIGRADEWGRALFGAEAWVIVAGIHSGGEILYYVAALDEALTSADLHVQPITSSRVPGVVGQFSGSVLDTLLGSYHVTAVNIRGDSYLAANIATWQQFSSQLWSARQQGLTGLAPEVLRTTVFAPIDELIASGGDEDLERAAQLLAELNATAFAVLDWETKSRYLEVLINAWTEEPQEVAIVEIIKSVGNQSELRAIFQQLRDADLWDQLFADLDSQLWSMLIVLGQRFGDPTPFGLDNLIQLMGEARLMVAPGIRLGPNGPEISVVDLAEIEEAALGFVRFAGGTLESLWMMISHPDKIIEGVGQLVKMIVMVQLAQLGYQPAQQQINRILREMGQQVIYGLKGAQVTGMASRIVSRIKWAIIWEVASWFVGVGEIRAAIRATGLTERAAALARLLRILGLAGRVAEGEAIASKLEKLARVMRRSSQVINREDEVLRLLAHLPEEDVSRLSRLLETVEVDETLNLRRMTQLHPELGEAAADSLRKVETLSQFAAKSGGLSDEVVEAFGLLSRLSTNEIADLVRVVPPGEGARFARAVRTIPATAFGSGGTASAEFLRAIAQNPSRMNVLANIGYDSFAAIYQRAGGNAQALDRYLAALSDLELAMPQNTRAADFRRLLDRLANGEEAAWRELENARRSRFGLREDRLDPATIERWIEEELERGRVEPSGFEPIQIEGTRPPRRQVSNLHEVDLSDLTPAQRTQYQRQWQNYQGPLQTLDDYIRFRHGVRTGQLPRGRRVARGLGEVGEVERRAGYILQDIVNTRLPAGSANARDIPTRFGNVRPDHLPPGQNTIYLDSIGRRTNSPNGTPFSASFVADSKYRDVVPTTDQTRGLASLTRYSDEQRLVFYVRWQEGFPAPTTLTRGAHNTGYVLPGEFIPQIVGFGVREEASRVGVQIQLVSDPLWK